MDDMIFSKNICENLITSTWYTSIKIRYFEDKIPCSQQFKIIIKKIAYERSVKYPQSWHFFYERSIKYPQSWHFFYFFGQCTHCSLLS